MDPVWKFNCTVNVLNDTTKCTENIVQMDGNDTIANIDDIDNSNPRKVKLKKNEMALNLPAIAVYNARSLFPKLDSMKHLTFNNGTIRK